MSKRLPSPSKKAFSFVTMCTCELRSVVEAPMSLPDECLTHVGLVFK